MDLAIRGGEVVTAGARFHGDVGIGDGRIVQLGGEVPAADRELDATGRLVLPGGVDAHVHLSPAYVPNDAGEETTIAWADDFASGSRAAAAGGITTIGNISFPRLGEGLFDCAERVAADAARDSVVDYIIHPVVSDVGPEVAADIPRLAEAGYASIKMFMMYETFDVHVREYVRVMELAGHEGLSTLLHCEDQCVLGHLAAKLMSAGKGHPSHWAEMSPVYAEAVSVARACAFAEATGAPIYIVHLSSAEALKVAYKAKSRGVPVTVETRPLYLFFDEDHLRRPDGPLYIGNPPLRPQADIDALWGGIRTGAVDTCCTDHAPHMRADKLDPDRDLTSALPGVAELDTILPLLFSAGVRAGRMSLERFIEITSTNAARTFGLYPRKGTIAIGSDADLAIWDPERTRTVRAADTQTRSDFSLYEGWEVTGWPVVTVSRGEIIAPDGDVSAAEGRGRMVPRGSAGSGAGALAAVDD